MKIFTIRAKWIRLTCALTMMGFMASSLRADMIVWGNSEVICDRYGAPMTGGLITLWKDGGNGWIDAYATGDDVQIAEASTSFSTNNPGYFHLLIDPVTMSQLADGVRVYTRIFDAATIGASLYLADIGWTNIPPALEDVADSTTPSPPWFYEVGGTRPDGKSWPPMTPTSFLELGPTNVEFGDIELGMSVTQQLTLSAWYYQSVPFSRSPLSLPYYSPDQTNGGIKAPGVSNFTIVCRPTSTGEYAASLTLQYLHPVYSNSLVLTSWVHAAGVLTDSDNDQMSDAWEQSHFGSLTNSMGTTSDSDGDGSPDASEWIAGTDPMDAGSVLSGVITPGTGSVFQIEWPSLGTASYTILTGTSLEQGVTGHLATAISGTPPVNSLAIPMPSDPRTFYRISVDQ